MTAARTTAWAGELPSASTARTATMTAAIAARFIAPRQVGGLSRRSARRRRASSRVAALSAGRAVAALAPRERVVHVERDLRATALGEREPERPHAAQAAARLPDLGRDPPRELDVVAR